MESKVCKTSGPVFLKAGACDCQALLSPKPDKQRILALLPLQSDRKLSPCLRPRPATDLCMLQPHFKLEKDKHHVMQKGLADTDNDPQSSETGLEQSLSGCGAIISASSMALSKAIRSFSASFCDHAPRTSAASGRGAFSLVRTAGAMFCDWELTARSRQVMARRLKHSLSRSRYQPLFRVSHSRSSSSTLDSFLFGRSAFKAAALDSETHRKASIMMSSAVGSQQPLWAQASNW